MREEENIMASVMCKCEVCNEEQSIPTASVPRDGLNFSKEVEYPCQNCFRTGRMLDPRLNRHFISTGIYKDGWGREIKIIFSNCLN